MLNIRCVWMRSPSLRSIKNSKGKQATEPPWRDDVVCESTTADEFKRVLRNEMSVDNRKRCTTWIDPEPDNEYIQKSEIEFSIRLHVMTTVYANWANCAVKKFRQIGFALFPSHLNYIRWWCNWNDVSAQKYVHNMIYNVVYHWRDRWNTFLIPINLLLVICRTINAFWLVFAYVIQIQLNENNFSNDAMNPWYLIVVVVENICVTSLKICPCEEHAYFGFATIWLTLRTTIATCFFSFALHVTGESTGMCLKKRTKHNAIYFDVSRWIMAVKCAQFLHRVWTIVITHSIVKLKNKHKKPNFIDLTTFFGILIISNFGFDSCQFYRAISIIHSPQQLYTTLMKCANNSNPTNCQCK